MVKSFSSVITIRLLRQIFLGFAAFLLAWHQPGLHAKQNKPMTVQQVARLRALILTTLRVQEELFSMMTKVGIDLARFLSTHKNAGGSPKAVEATLKRTHYRLKSNPFLREYDPEGNVIERKPDPRLPPQAQPKPVPRPTISYTIDRKLDKETVKQYKINPPESWKASPGTISVVCNAKDLFILWGAGTDSLPIRSQETNRVRMIVGEY